MNDITKSCTGFFILLLVLGSVCILKGYDIGMYFLMNSENGWDINRQILSGAAWITFGGVLSLLSGYGLIKIILKYIG
ncbi:hypothetical protein [Clostridium aminobutyricum]|uniref:Uncharacterized protein n=1 Tax=Clostridium aminobutyricum TaxID=33953 RepID=A0A939D8T7_CLOAM|nr:hypothetical protein [Clostridium aminobutyricum]MBN7773235.1 hypothetical protein [Clostridium aminobutyricum]